MDLYRGNSGSEWIFRGRRRRGYVRRRIRIGRGEGKRDDLSDETAATHRRRRDRRRHETEAWRQDQSGSMDWAGSFREVDDLLHEGARKIRQGKGAHTEGGL